MSDFMHDRQGVGSYMQRLGRLSGCAQHQRLPEIIRPDYIPVDERSMAQLLVALRAYAKNTRFFNIENKEQGSWDQLFQSTDALILSRVMSLGLAARKQRYLERQALGLHACLKEFMVIIDVYNDWLRYAPSLKQPLARKVHSQFRRYIDNNVSSVICNMNAFIDRTIPKHAQVKYAAITDSELPRYCKAHVKSTDDAARFNGTTHTQKLTFLSDRFAALLRGLDILQHAANSAFMTLLAQQVHEPATGMLLTFLKAYQHSQDKLNTLPKRMYDFYYEKVLGNRAQLGAGDKVILSCVLSPAKHAVNIPRGTVFSAGKTADLQEMRYISTENAVLTGCQLVALKSVFLQRHRAISPENLSAGITRVKVQDFLSSTNAAAQPSAATVAAGASIHADRVVPTRPASIFGFDDGTANNVAARDARIGLYISSSILALKEGRRKVQLDLVLHDRVVLAMERLKNKLEDADAADSIALTLPEWIATSTLLPAQRKLAFLFYSAMDPRLTAQAREQTSLLMYCAKITDSYLAQWFNRERVDFLLELKRCLLALYLRIDDVLSLGIFHHQLMARHIAQHDFLSASERMQMLKHVGSFSDADDGMSMKLADMKRDLAQTSFSLLVRYFQDAFELRFSQAQGWLSRKNYSISHIPVSEDQRSGLRITTVLPAELAPIVATSAAIHGPLHRSNKPTVIVSINPLTKSYPLSWFEDIRLAHIGLSVDVKGLRDLSIHNEYGRVDPSKPFLPFSALPQDGTRCYIGGYEFAKKSLTQLSVDVEWKNLPSASGGLSAYFSDYAAVSKTPTGAAAGQSPSSMSNNDFKVCMTMLAHGNLVPVEPNMRQKLPLFSAHAISQVLLPKSSFNYRLSQPNPRINEALDKKQFDDFSAHKHAYICLSLQCSTQGFGHHAYPRIMGDVLTHNARRRKKRSSPNAPFSPEIAHIHVNYSASEQIALSTDYGALQPETLLAQRDHTRPQSSNSSVYYLSPVGLEAATMGAGGAGLPLFPQWQHSGNLYIGFTCTRLSDRLCLYFQLGSDSTHRANGHQPELHWQYYAQTGWKPLDHGAILSDSTNGLMVSGIMNISLPTDAVVHPGFLPENTHWLLVSNSNAVRHFSSLQGLSFDAITVRAENNANKVSKHCNGRSDNWVGMADVSGVIGFSQSQPAFANNNMEDQHQAQVRMFERLRHKNRALCAWDYERIVLEAFPEVALVKCLPNCQFNVFTPQPGHILVVVVPAVMSAEQPKERGKQNGIQLNAVIIKRIARHLRDIAPPSATIEVVNASYESIQVRCAVAFHDSEYSGELSKKLQRDLDRYVSPWTDVGFSAGFSWVLNTKELEAYIKRLSYVARIGRTSLVKCFGENTYPEYYRLDDTAAAHIASPIENTPSGSPSPTALNKVTDLSTTGKPGLRSSCPWSLPIPSKNHFIELLNENQSEALSAQPVGINSLEIGNTFVIRERRHNAKA